MKVSLYTRSQGKYDWKNEVLDLGRIPQVGEFIARAANAPWYVVQLVVHTPYLGDCAAEVYTVEADRDKAKHQALHGKP
jgi:hypothetical protein